MRTTIEISERKLKEAMLLSGAKTKREAVNISLSELISNRRRARLIDKLGRTELAIDLEALKDMREEN